MTRDLRGWIGRVLRLQYPPDANAQTVLGEKSEAIAINRIAAEENAVAAQRVSDAISELVAQMETKRNA